MLFTSSLWRWKQYLLFILLLFLKVICDDGSISPPWISIPPGTSTLPNTVPELSCLSTWKALFVQLLASHPSTITFLQLAISIKCHFKLLVLQLIIFEFLHLIKPIPFISPFLKLSIVKPSIVILSYHFSLFTFLLAKTVKEPYLSSIFSVTFFPIKVTLLGINIE